MKKREFKKLSLNKKTIAALKSEALGRIKGGCDCNCTCPCCCPTQEVTCQTCDYTCYPCTEAPTTVTGDPRKLCCFNYETYL